MDTPIFDEALAAASEPTVAELIAAGLITYEAPADTESEGAYLIGGAA